MIYQFTGNKKLFLNDKAGLTVSRLLQSEAFRVSDEFFTKCHMWIKTFLSGEFFMFMKPSRFKNEF